MAKIVIADGIDEGALKALKQISYFEVDLHKGIPAENLLTALQGADFVVVRSATKLNKGILEKLPNLKGILRSGVGIDNVDVKTAEELGIWVWNAPKGNFQSTAEMAIAMMFALARQIPQATEGAHQGKWLKNELSKSGRQIMGANFGVYGAGNIGFKTARMARALGMEVMICDPVYQSGKEYKKVEFDELLKTSDYIAIHAPLVASTKHVFNLAAFEKMKKSSFIINIARGGIINEEDLLKALDTGLIAGAGLDVFEVEPPPMDKPLYKNLLSHPKLVTTPHLGASTVEAQRLVGEETVEKLHDVARSVEEKNYRAPKALNNPPKPRMPLAF